ncbi:MAG TPA: fibrinogen-like YCDxxxxGGGW domain-containing protein [Kofleriaceae bacterium]|nr:fibrinogen-like YCDxxxxGGGW domain-containing protein [Kofleriaceae bacterium]
MGRAALLSIVVGVVGVVGVAGCGRLGFGEDGPTTLRTCADAKRANQPTGITTLDPDGSGELAARDVWCDQDRSGGGWALALKIDGAQPTFAGTSTVWSDVTLVDAGNLDPAAPGEAKLAPYVDTAFAEVLLVVEGGGEVVVPLRAPSLRSAMASGLTLPTSVAEADWRAAFGMTSLETGCRRQGLGLQGDPALPRGVRLGILANTETTECRSAESFVGIGGNVPCPDGTVLAAGAASSIAGDAGALCKPARVLVFVRDDDRTHLGAAASCKDHLAAGHSESGVYLVGDPAVPTRCEMTIGGGGWTAALDFDALRDPCPAGWQPVAAAGPGCTVVDGAQISGVSIAPPLASYREVMTTLLAFQRGTADGYEGQGSIDDAYLDGLSITVGTPRQHVASYAVGYDEATGCNMMGACTCPCLGGIAAPAFAPEAARRCEAGALSVSIDGTVVFADPLFDGVELPAACAGEGRAEPIQTLLGGATSDPIEARLMRNEIVQAEGLVLSRLELWVR